MVFVTKYLTRACSVCVPYCTFLMKILSSYVKAICMLLWPTESWQDPENALIGRLLNGDFNVIDV